MIHRILAILSLFIFTLALNAKEPKGSVFTDPAEAGKDYSFQGEYLGNLPDNTEMKLGVQVIALGKGKFDLIAYVGGLPGEGWERGGMTHLASGEREGDKVTFTSKDAENKGYAILEEGSITVFDGEGTQLIQISKVMRESKTMGAKPPEGAIVLFDGSTAEKFEGGKLIEEKYLGATNCSSKETFGDHKLHVEFRTPFMPEARGQGRGNSGVYIQERYELQVLDSFGLNGENNECGGIYSISKPKVNMCFPPLSWQTYDIDFKAAKYEGGKKIKNAQVTIQHNGITIHHDLELPHGTPGRKKEGENPLGVFFQNHGNPVAFRNIWVEKK